MAVRQSKQGIRGVVSMQVVCRGIVVESREQVGAYSIGVKHKIVFNEYE